MADLSDEDFPGYRPLGNYQGFAYGPGFRPENVQEESLSLDGTNQKLRDPALGSPFTFRMRAPSVLLNALAGGGEAGTSGPFDPLLRTVFDKALGIFETVQDDEGATAQDLENARAGLFGGRAPAATNVNIIEAAQRANSNFQIVKAQDSLYRTGGFVGESATRGATLSKKDDLIAENGERFNPADVGQTQANQTAVSDLQQARSALNQLNKMLATPPLTLLINPEQLQIQYAKKQSYTDRTRFNHIFQAWGEEQPRLSVSGRSAGFVVGAFGGADEVERTHEGLTPTKTAEPTGYQYASKWDSAAWQNLMSLFAFYRNNGYIYDTNGGLRSEAHLFIGNIEISYDQWVYVGNFENFRYSYEEGKQHGAVQFSFDFIVSFMFDRAQPGDVKKWKSPTPSPSEEVGGTFNLSADIDALLDQSYNAEYGQNAPDGAGGSTSTAVLDPHVVAAQELARDLGGII